MGKGERHAGNNISYVLSVSSNVIKAATHFKLTLLSIRYTIPVHYVCTSSRMESCFILKKLTRI